MGFELILPYILITAEGSRPLPEKVEAITNYKLPATIHDLWTFLGMINFYRRYLKDAAKTQAHLHELLKGTKTKDRRKVHWTDDTRRSFEKCKTDHDEATLLSFPRSGLPLSLCTDASDFAVDSVLQQFENEGWKPIAFYSKKLNDTKKIGRLPPSEDMKYCLTCIGRYSSRIETIPLPDITAEIVVLLGLRGAIRPDSNHSIASKVYGTNIKLPGEFFEPPTIKMDQETFVSQLQEFMEDLKPVPSNSVKHQRIFVHKDLRSCSHVFVRIDRVKKSLEPPYQGPYKVVERSDKFFTLSMKDKNVNIYLLTV
ncbi:retrovirus-related Pol polyprotein from transposon opus [Trichonephila clavipes]|nr:retrovirus-related Pol polyprotein from transposon opus [Trichonephila clavipes]